MRTPASARRAFWLLATLGGASLLALAGLLAWQGQRLAEGVWLACQSVVAAVGGLLPTLGLALPLLMLAVGLMAGLGSLAWQFWNTQRLVGAVSSRAVPLPPGIQAGVDRLGLTGRVELVEDGDAYAFTQGLVHPRIWVSTALVGLLDTDELAAVLCHERYHVQQHDPLRVLLSRAVAHGLFFVPAAAALRNAYLVAKEIEADAASQADTALAAALVKLLRHGNALPAYANVAAIGPLDTTTVRIERLLDHRPPRSGVGSLVRPRHIVASLLLALALLAVSAWSISRAAAPLTGGECGYTTQPSLIDIQVTPADYTPATGGLY